MRRRSGKSIGGQLDYKAFAKLQTERAKAPQKNEQADFVAPDKRPAKDLTPPSK
jgi:hypothetical protein